VLEKHELAIIEHGAGNFEVRAHPGLFAKVSYWRWPESGLQGNAIDFCTRVLRLSFHQAMRELTASSYDTSAAPNPTTALAIAPLRWERGCTPRSRCDHKPGTYQ